MTVCTFASRKEAKDAKWFSRRHQTQADHDLIVSHHPRMAGKHHRRVMALARHEDNLQRLRDELKDLTDPAMCYPKEWSTEDLQRAKWDTEYKIRNVKRVIANAKKNLGMTEENDS